MITGKKDRGNVDVSVTVDVSKIVRNAAIAGVLIVGIVFGCSTYKKLLDWEDCDCDCSCLDEE